MPHKKANAAMGIVVALSGGSATAAGPGPSKSIACAMASGSKLAPGSIRAADVCNSIEAAVRKRVPNASVSVRIVAPSASMLVATVRMHDGRVLPEQVLGVSDGVLDQRSVSRLADAIATQVADAVRS
jgi:hypothetical protein